MKKLGARVGLRFVLIGFILVLIVILGVFHMIFQRHVGDPSFKYFAETKIGEFLQAKVQIGNIHVGFFNRVVFTGLDIDAGEETGVAYRVHIREVIFRYNILQLLTQNFRSPAAVIFEAPQISVPGELFPYAIFEQLDFGEGSGSFASLQMTEGYIRYQIPTLKSNFELRGVEGSFQPVENGIYQMDFDARVYGFAEGTVHVEGEVDAVRRTHRLRLDLKSVEFAKDVPIPLNEVVGKARWEDDNLYFDELSGLFHGWKADLSGSLEKFMASPRLNLRWEVGKKDLVFEGGFLADLEKNQLVIESNIGERELISLRGSIRQNGLRFMFDHLRLNDRYDGIGWFDFESGDYRLQFQKENQNVSIVSNLKGLDFDLSLNLNHVEAFGLDLVTAAQIRLSPLGNPLRERLWRLRGAFNTDYFILEYASFDDLLGSFEVTPYGIKNFKSTWGRVFSLDGSVSFRGDNPEGKFALRVGGFDLKNVEAFANKPLPKDLGGILEGKLKIEGALNYPEIIGNFTVKDGILGKLEYDRGLMQFRGFPPQLKLYDSHIVRGRTNLALEGVLDLSLANVFHGVEIRTPDKFAVWKGWEISTDQVEHEAAIDRNLMPSLALKAGGGDTNGKMASEDGDPEEDSYVVVGPQFEF